MKIKVYKRLAVALIALAMSGTTMSANVGHTGLFSGFAITARAEVQSGYGATGVASWTALKAAVDGAQSGDVIRLTENITDTTSLGSSSSSVIKITDGKDITIDLNGKTLDRNRSGAHADGHVFWIVSGGSLTVMNGTLKGGYATNGGGINNKGTIVLAGVTITGCEAAEKGGAIYNEGTMTVTDCTLNDNISYGDGGGIWTKTSNNVTITDSTISGNHLVNAEGKHGGGMFISSGTVTMTGSTITENFAPDGGGIYIEAAGALRISDTNIIGNATTIHGGGGITNYGTVSVTDSLTVTANSSIGNGGGIWNGGTLNVEGKVIVKDNTGGRGTPNLYLNTGKVITLTGALDADSEIGVTTAINYAVLTENYSEYHSTDDPADFFFIDNSTHLIPATDENGEVSQYADTPVSYIDIDGSTKQCNKYHIIETDTVNWTAGWYVAEGEVTIDARVEVSGTVNLILADGCELSVPKGIHAPVGTSFTVWGQSDSASTGALFIDGSSVADNNAGIGGNDTESCGALTFNGGGIAVIGGNEAAGIGNGANPEISYSSIITINGGSVFSVGGDHGAGIGNGSTYEGSFGYRFDLHGPEIIINGGYVTALGGTRSAGIGGGYDSMFNDIWINGGSVYAAGSAYAAGIGCGNLINHFGGHEYEDIGIHILGGTVTASTDYSENPATRSRARALMQGSYATAGGNSDAFHSFVEVYMGARVTAGTTEENATEIDLREHSLIDEFWYVMIEPCDHTGATYTHTPSTHTRTDCPHCDSTGETQAHTFNANGICTVCGYEAAALLIHANTVSFKDNLTLNFLASIDDGLTDGAYVTFTYNHYGTEKEVTVPINTSDKHGNEYRFRCALTASEMTIPVTARLYLANMDEPVSTWTRSIRDYCIAGLEDANTPEKEKTLLRATLNYGGYTQQTFGYNPAPYANADYVDSVEDVQVASSVSFTRPIGFVNGLEYTGATVFFRYAPYVRYYFKTADGVSISDYTFKIGDKSITPTPKNGEYYIESDAELAYQLDNLQNVVVTKGDEEVFNFDYSIIKWAEIAAADTENTKDRDMAKAMYVYYQAAKAFVAANQS